MICYAKLLAKSNDHGYITYVFRILDKTIIKEMKTFYLMCVQFPNWEQDVINLGDTGYLKTKEVKAGVDEWYDGDGFVKYKYTNVIFEKFIKAESLNTEEIYL